MNRQSAPGPLSCATLLGGLIVTVIGGLVRASTETVNLRVGELLHVRARSAADHARDIFYEVDGVLEPRLPFFLAAASGQTTIQIAGWRNDIILRVTVE